MRLHSKQIQWAIVALLVMGVGVRLAAVRGDLWLDEIWSIELAKEAGGPLGVFTALHHDNNHYLNTLWLQLLGDHRPSWVYRVAPLLASLLWLVWVGLAVARRNRSEAVLVLLLLSPSYLFVLQGTEARGYALLLLFLVLSWSCLDLEIRGRSGPWGPLFGVFSILGLLAHLSFSVFLLGGAAWVVFGSTRSSGRSHGMLRVLVRLFGLPAVIVLLLYWVDGRHIRVGGAPLMNAAEAVGQATALALGLPATGFFLALAPVVLGATAVVELERRRKKGDSEWILFAVSIFIAPALALALALALARPPFVAARYFLIPVFLTLLLLAGLLCRWWKEGETGKRVTVALVLVVIVGGNVVQLGRFLTALRGEYAQAVERLAVEAANRPISVGSDHDHRNRTVLEFYTRREHPELAVEYIEVGDWEARQPEWLFLHSFAEGLYGHPVLKTPAGSYALVETYRHYGLSGWDWFLYRKE